MAPSPLGEGPRRDWVAMGNGADEVKFISGTVYAQYQPCVNAEEQATDEVDEKVRREKALDFSG